MIRTDTNSFKFNHNVWFFYYQPAPTPTSKKKLKKLIIFEIYIFEKASILGEVRNFDLHQMKFLDQKNWDAILSSPHLKILNTTFPQKETKKCNV